MSKKLNLNNESLDISEQDVDLMKIKFEMTDSLSTLSQKNFLQRIYKEAQLHLNSLMKDSTQSEIKNKLEELNDIIKNCNVNNAESVSESDKIKTFIDILIFLDKFQSAKPYHDLLEKNSADTAARQRMNKINNFLKNFNQKHDYSES
ncbi:MAG: hypothetical protein LQ347_000834 [Umbilicaria vellea]|nr:MAG: hypothetical protein LQ347_000834 [Umbilicaria vellea]